jgi:pimeloyl-ACP methyl ester carboxylesterase
MGMDLGLRNPKTRTTSCRPDVAWHVARSVLPVRDPPRIAVKSPANVHVHIGFPNHTIKLPSAYDTHFRRLAQLAAADPAVAATEPDLVALLERVLAKLEREPAVVKLDDPAGGGRGAVVEVPVGPFGLLFILRLDLGDTQDLPVVPRLLHHVDQGDLTELTWFVSKRHRQFSTVPVLLFTMDLASGATVDRLARVREEVPRSLFGGVMNLDDDPLRAIWRPVDLGPDFRAPIVSTVRTLFLSGDLDVNTPPYQAEEVRWGFANGTHLVSANGGHEDWFRNPRMQDAVRRFLGGEDVSHMDIDMPPLRFVALDGPPMNGVTHPSVR